MCKVHKSWNWCSFFSWHKTGLPHFARWCISVSPQSLTRVRGIVNVMLNQRLSLNALILHYTNTMGLTFILAETFTAKEVSFFCDSLFKPTEYGTDEGKNSTLLKNHINLLETNVREQISQPNFLLLLYGLVVQRTLAETVCIYPSPSLLPQKRGCKGQRWRWKMQREQGR